MFDCVIMLKTCGHFDRINSRSIFYLIDRDVYLRTIAYILLDSETVI